MVRAASAVFRAALPEPAIPRSSGSPINFLIATKRRGLPNEMLFGAV